MFKKKYRSLIPNETNPLKTKEKNTYSESYDINGFDDKVKFEIKLLRTEISNYDVSGNYAYQIKNNSHYDIEAELDFCNSLHFRTNDKRNKDINESIFHAHIEPYQEILRKKKKEKDNNKSNICKVQYNRGYFINTRIKFAFTFPSLKKQRQFILDEHKEIQDNLNIWKKWKPFLLEQLFLFYNEKAKDKKSHNKKINPNKNNIENIPQKYKYYEILEIFSKKNNLDNNNNNNQIEEISSKNSEKPIKKLSSNTKLASILNNEETIETKHFYFVDETFPPFQIDYKIMDLEKESLINPKKYEKEKEKENEYKHRYILYHYRPIESLNPGSNIILNTEYINPYDIKSGLVKNINIISVFSHLAGYPKILQKIFEDNEINDIGIYTLKLFFQGSWTNVYLDKFIPCFPLDFPIYTYSPLSLWPSILEKALAKLFRGYDNLYKISYFELYQILTGFPIYHFKKINKERDNSSKINLYEKFLLKDLANITQNYRYIVNSNLPFNKASEVISKEDIINYYIKYNIKENTSNDYFIKINLSDQKNIITEPEKNYIFDTNSTFGENNPYLLGFYTSESHLQNLVENHGFPISKEMIKSIAKKLFAVKEANAKYLNIKSIYNYQLKKFIKFLFNEENSNDDSEKDGKEKENKETDSLAILWDIILTLFDNIIIVKANKYDELHFRNAFVRCQDVEHPEQDRILAHTYYELTIKKQSKVSNIKIVSNETSIKDENESISKERKRESNESLSPTRADKKRKMKDFKRKKSSIKIRSMNASLNKSKNISNLSQEIIPVTITLNLSNEHFLDTSFYSKELDMKLGILKISKLTQREKSEENNQSKIDESSKLTISMVQNEINNLNQIINQIFKGKIPILAINSDFQIGHSLVYDLFLEEGTYIIVPMTMGYCMQSNPKIISKKYVIKDKKKEIPLNKTVINKFLDDLFYINDPFCKNYLPMNILKGINKALLDNKGNQNLIFDESKIINEYSKLGNIELDTKEKFGLSRLSFKNMIYDSLNTLKEEYIKRSVCNLGYEENTYPYLNKLINISFYFEKQKNNKSDIISIIPKNNLIDVNMDSLINIRILEDCKENRKANGPIRVYYKNESDSWYVIEGAYMKRFPNDKRSLETKKFYYNFNGEIYEKRKVFYSTFKKDLKVQINPGNLIFILYAVEDILFYKSKTDYKEIESEETDDDKNNEIGFFDEESPNNSKDKINKKDKNE